MGCTSSVDGRGPNQIRRAANPDLLKKMQPIDHQRIKMVLDYWYGYSGNGNNYDLAYLVGHRTKALGTTGAPSNNPTVGSGHKLLTPIRAPKKLMSLEEKN